MYCETVSSSHEPYQFKVAYDKLIIASGAEPLTFGINGVKEHAFFLREVNHAQEIRKKLLLNLMLSENPGIPPTQIIFSYIDRKTDALLQNNYISESTIFPEVPVVNS